MDHPFHVHGWTFQPYEIEYTHVADPTLNYVETIDFVEEKDTFRVPGRKDPVPFSSNTTMRAYATFNDDGREGTLTAEGLYPDDDTSGGWLAHCHILEHSRNGMMVFFESRYEDALFHLLGTGLAGSAGIPVLRLAGPLTGGSNTTLTLKDAAPNAFAGVVVGNTLNPQPFLGGTLVPNLDVLRFFATDGTGQLVLNAAWPNGLPADSELFWQAWIQDVGAPEGYAASNAVKSITP